MDEKNDNKYVNHGCNNCLNHDEEKCNFIEELKSLIKKHEIQFREHAEDHMNQFSYDCRLFIEKE
jgi:hypothetical protein